MDTPVPRRSAPRRPLRGGPPRPSQGAGEVLGQRQEQGSCPVADLPPPDYSTPDGGGRGAALAEEDDHVAQRLLLGDALCCECASRLAQLRSALSRGQAMLDQAVQHSRDRAAAHARDEAGAAVAGAAETLEGSGGEGRGGAGADAAPDAGGEAELTVAMVGAALGKERGRLRRLRQLESQLERALHNQRRYVLGRHGLGHLADGE
jgi:hypothetical protein